MTKDYIGKYCIVRGDRSGVFAGTVAEMDEKVVRLENVRRLWYWDGAASISQMAVDGTKAPDNCKFTISVPVLILTDCIELIPTSDAARKSIESVRAWKR